MEPDIFPTLIYSLASSCSAANDARGTPPCAGDAENLWANYMRGASLESLVTLVEAKLG